MALLDLPDGTATGLVVIAVLYLLLRVKQYFAWRNQIDLIPGPPAELLAGTAKQTGGMADKGARLAFIRDAVQKWPKVYRLWNGPNMPMVFLCHPDTVKPILGAKDNYKSHFMPKLFRPHLGNSIFVQNGPEWRRSRKLLTPTFHFNVLRHYMQESVEVVDLLIDRLLKRDAATAGKVTDAQELIVELTLDILLQNIFSFKPGSAEKWGPEFTGATKNCDDWVARRIDNPLWIMSDMAYFRSKEGKGFMEDANTMKRICRKVIKERRLEHAAKTAAGEPPNEQERLDFLDLIMLTEDKDDGKRMSDEEVEAQTITFMSAGFGTTTSAVSFTLYCLAQNQEHQDKCAEEAREVFADGGKVEYGDLSKLKFNYMCFKEATRIYPPAGGIARDLTEPTVIEGVTVDKGTTVVASIYGIHHNPLVWPDPEKYDPYRFDPDRAEKRDAYSWLLFSAGPRNCIGQKFAEMQVKIILAKLIAKFKFSIPDGTQPPSLVPSVILKSSNGVDLLITPR